MLSIKSKNSNLEYTFLTENNGVKYAVKGLPTFVNIEKILTEINPLFDTELRMMEFTPEQAKKIQDKILSSYIPEMETPPQPPPGANFPFENLKRSFAVNDDRTSQVWHSQLKLLHIVSRGSFIYSNEGN
jgi:hypothetical protein